jgi:hypothetical protein
VFEIEKLKSELSEKDLSDISSGGYGDGEMTIKDGKIMPDFEGHILKLGPKEYCCFSDEHKRLHWGFHADDGTVQYTDSISLLDERFVTPIVFDSDIGDLNLKLAETYKRGVKF